MTFLIESLIACTIFTLFVSVFTSKRLLPWLSLTPGQCEDLKKQFLSNVNVDYLSIILDADDKVVGFGVAMPSLSKAVQKAKGSLFPFGFTHILKALKHNDTLDLLLIAIDEHYQNKGVNAMIFDKKSIWW